MISLILFILHIIFVIFIFIVKVKKSVSDAFINLALIVIIFSVGWTISTSFTKMVFPGEGLGKYLMPDDFSLLILSIAETVFYKIYFKNLFTEDGKET